MSQPDATQLHQFLLDHFSLEGLKTLCLNLGVEYDDLGGEGRAGKARELVLHMQRLGRLVDLRAVLARQREGLYEEAFGEVAARPAVTAEPLPRRDRRRPPRNPRQIFISHATADAAFAHRLAGDLRREGYAIWIAPESIPEGQWVSAINRGLAESGIMLLVLTPAAAESPWVEMETNVAIELERAGEMRFIPVCLERDRYELTWHAYQWVMCDRDYAAGWRELLGRLDTGHSITPAPPPPNTPTPLPPAPRPFRLEDIVSRTGEPSLSNVAVHEKTGIQFVRIPAGPFLFGDDNKTVELPEYWIGRYPVTNAQYKRFVDATGHRAPGHWKDKAPPPDKLDHPVVFISWHDAQALAEWAGLRLPTEPEWEKAARGTDGRRYPWGIEEPTAERCNFNNKVGDTTPVGQYSPKGDSPYDCADMAGNVWEWTASLYEPGKGRRVLKGGAYYTSDASSLRGAFRYWYDPAYDNGFDGARLAVSPSS